MTLKDRFSGQGHRAPPADRDRRTRDPAKELRARLQHPETGRGREVPAGDDRRSSETEDHHGGRGRS